MKFRSEQWRMAKLGDIFKISSGGTPSKSKPEYYENGTVPWVRTGDLKDKYIAKVEGSITEEALNNSSAKLFPVNTVLIAMYGATIGACSILSVEAATNQACAAFLPTKEVHSSYMYYFLRSKKDDFVKMGVGGAQPNISATILKGVIIPLPPLETQKQIAKTLDTAAELLGMRKLQLAELDNLIKSTFYDMFGDPVTNEKGWVKKTLSKFINKKRDISYGIVQRGPHVEGGVPIVRIRDIIEASFLESELVRTTIENSEKYSRTILQGSEILLSIRGTIGKVAIAPPYSKGWNISREVAIVPVEGEINILFLANLLVSKPIQNIFQSMVKGIAQSGMNLADIRILEIIYPPITLQNQFAEIITNIEEQKVLVKKAIDETQYLFDSLMAEYFE